MALDDKEKQEEKVLGKRIEFQLPLLEDGTSPWLRNLNEARAYRSWKQEVPAFVRRVVEGAMLGKKMVVGKDFTPLVGQFLSSMQRLLIEPGADVDALNVDPRIKNQLGKIGKIPVDERTFVDVFEVLQNPEIGFEQKLKWYKSQVEPRLRWLQQQDAVPAEPPAELIAPGQQNELVPSMDEMKESKEELGEGFYEVSPFYGGYYKGHVYEQWDAVNLKWMKDQKKLSERAGQGDATGDGAGAERAVQSGADGGSADAMSAFASADFAEGTVRTMRGKFTAGKFQAVDLPYGFSIDQMSLKLPEAVLENGSGVPAAEVKFFQDQDGVWYGKLSSGGGETAAPVSDVELEFKIGKLQNPVLFVPENKDFPTPASALPSDVLQKIKDARSANVPAISKARILCRFVKNHLEYSNDSGCNDLYRANPGQYFNAMWQNKKADCDVANTFAAEVLRHAGIRVRMISGHYVKSASKSGSAVLHGGTGHAWLEAFDEEKNVWERMDATPKGDPNLDEKEQEKDLQDVGEGDYGEQEAEVMSDEDLQKMVEELEKSSQRPVPESPEVKFAKEAGCTPFEAGQVLQKIQKLRQLKDSRGRNILQQSKATWHEVIKKNFREKIFYTGPVRMHEGDDLVDVVEASIDVKSGERNPSGFEKKSVKPEVQKYFGGFEVYLASDLSGSMNDVDPQTGQRKSEAQRDCAFLFVDSIMSNALEVKKNQRALKAPMPVKVCLTVFGAKTEVVLPLTDQWGPKEQIKLYRALDQFAGGGTPDDVALNMVRQQISEAQKDQEKVRKQVESTHQGKKSAQPWNMHRFVAVFADGGSNDAGAVRNLVQTMRDEGTVVYGFGITESGKAMEAVYAPDAVTISDSSKLAEVGLQTLVKTIKKWYDI